MKNFSDFVATLTEEEFVTIANSINKQALQLSDDSGNISAEKLSNAIGSMSSIMTMSLLGKYHEWLHK